MRYMEPVVVRAAPKKWIFILVAVGQCGAEHGAGQHLFHISHQLDWLFFGHGTLKKGGRFMPSAWAKSNPFPTKKGIGHPSSIR
jgi:hypothetical protein